MVSKQIRAILDLEGNIKSTHDYEPFGVELQPLSDESTNFKYKYTGQERDNKTGLDYMHFRYYASAMGRFLKPDNLIPDLTNPQNWNAYSYVKGNPVNFNDPTGHMYRQSGHYHFDYAPWMGISETPDLEEYLWGGSGGGGAGVVGTPGNTISNLLHGFDVASLNDAERDQFVDALLILSRTSLGMASLNAIKAPGLPIQIKSVNKKVAPFANYGRTVTNVSNGKIAGFTVELNFGRTITPQKAPFGDFTQFRGLKGATFKLVEVIGHEFRHIEYDLANPAEAVERVGYEQRGEQGSDRYKELQNKAHSNDIYPYEKQLWQQLLELQ